MRITCVIDNLDSGGAQRQMAMLATLLKARGHIVRLLTYYPHDFYKPSQDKAGVPVEYVPHRGKLHRIWAMRKAIRAGRPQVVIAYLQTPSIIAELASLPRCDYALIVSERNQDHPMCAERMRGVSLFLHRLADAVVTNSRAQEVNIRKIAPKLAPRVTTILNCVDLHQFRPLPMTSNHSHGPVRILCVGRFDVQKNYLRLVEAAEIVSRWHPEMNVEVDVYGCNYFVDGKPSALSGEFLKLQDVLKRSSVGARFHLHDPVRDVVTLYQQADVLCLPSLWEGCPNVVCEAMACGRPVLASRVGDNPVLVEDGVNGFLFDPMRPDDIASAICGFAKLSHQERVAMGNAGRQRAERLLSPERFVGQYEQLIDALERRSSRRA
jgi:glycosyltransferase involved in cell wall biosynthesis